jgi:hypothetical protein
MIPCIPQYVHHKRRLSKQFDTYDKHFYYIKWGALFSMMVVIPNP